MTKRQRLTELTGVGARASSPETHVPAQRARAAAASTSKRTVVRGAISLLLRQNDKIITSFRNEIAARFEGLEGKIDVRFDAMDRRLEELDKEVTNLATRFWRSQ